MILQQKGAKYALFMLTIAILLLGGSCIKEDFSKIKSGPWEPEFAFPLVKTTLSVESLLNDSVAGSFLEVDDNNLPWVVYSTDLFSFTASDIIDIPDTSVSTSIDMSDFTISPPPNGATIVVGDPDPLIQSVDFNAGAGVQLDSITFKSGNLELGVTSELQHDFVIYFEIPIAHNGNGVIFSDSITVNNSGNGDPSSNTVTLDLDLSGYTFDLTKNGSTYNQFDVEIKVAITKGPDPVNGDEVTTIFENFTNLAFDVLYGYIGQQTIPAIQDSMQLSIFSSTAVDGEFSIKDPELKLTLSNSYGVPIQMNFVEFSAFSWEQGKDGQTNLLSDGADSVYIEGPGLDRVGDTVNTAVIFDKDNIDIEALLEEAPDYLIYNLEGITNPLGNIQNNFVMDTSKIDINMEIRVPVYGTATGFSMIDTIAVDLGETISEIDHLGLLLNITNGFPVEIGIQVYLMDSTNNFEILDSLFAGGPAIMASATADPVTGDVITATASRLEATADTQLLNKVENTTHMKIVATIATFNDGNTAVKIYTDYEIAVKVGGLVGISTTVPPNLDSLNFGFGGDEQ